MKSLKLTLVAAVGAAAFAAPAAAISAGGCAVCGQGVGTAGAVSPNETPAPGLLQAQSALLAAGGGNVLAGYGRSTAATAGPVCDAPVCVEGP